MPNEEKWDAVRRVIEGVAPGLDPAQFARLTRAFEADQRAAEAAATGVKPIRNWAEAMPTSGLVLITGFIGSGKSVLAWEIANNAHKQGHAVCAFDFPDSAQKAMPRWIHHLSNVNQVSAFKPKRNEKGYNLLVVDEAALKANARRSGSSDNLEWMKLMAIARHKGFVVLLLSQQARQADINMVSEAALVLMKRPSELHLRFSRPELKPELQEAWDRFTDLTDANAMKQVYAVDYVRGRRGWLRNGVPEWWTEKISKAFADAELTNTGVVVEAKIEDKKRRRPKARKAAA